MICNRSRNFSRIVNHGCRAPPVRSAALASIEEKEGKKKKRILNEAEAGGGGGQAYNELEGVGGGGAYAVGAGELGLAVEAPLAGAAVRARGAGVPDLDSTPQENRNQSIVLREEKQKLPDGLVPDVRRFTYIGSRSSQEPEQEEEEEGRRRERSRPNRRRCTTEGAAHVPLLVRPTPTTFL